MAVGTSAVEDAAGGRDAAVLRVLYFGVLYFGEPADVERTEALIRDRNALHPLFPYGEEGDYLRGEAENPSCTAQVAWMADHSA
jgi:hypothetical protein